MILQVGAEDFGIGLAKEVDLCLDFEAVTMDEVEVVEAHRYPYRTLAHYRTSLYPDATLKRTNENWFHASKHHSTKQLVVVGDDPLKREVEGQAHPKLELMVREGHTLDLSHRDTHVSSVLRQDTQVQHIPAHLSPIDDHANFVEVASPSYHYFSHSILLEVQMEVAEVVHQRP